MDGETHRGKHNPARLPVEVGELGEDGDVEEDGESGAAKKAKIGSENVSTSEESDEMVGRVAGSKEPGERNVREPRSVGGQVAAMHRLEQDRGNVCERKPRKQAGRQREQRAGASAGERGEMY